MRIKLVIIFLVFAEALQAQHIQKDSILIEVLSIDTLHTQLNSIQTEFEQKSDSIKQELQDGLGKIESAKASVQSKIDSLSNLRLPTDEYTAKLDSLNDKANKLVKVVNSKLANLKSSTLDKVNELHLPPELNSQIDNLKGSISGFELPGLKGINSSTLNEGLANLNIGNLNIESISNLTGDLNLPDTSLPGVSSITELGKDQLSNMEGLENVGGVADQVGGYSEDIKKIANGDLKDVQQIPQAIEKEVMQMDELSELSEGTAALDGYKKMVASFKDEKAMQEMAIEKAKEVAIDHFADKGAELKAAMNKIAKYKQKFSNINSLSEITKRPPNPMKGKPFIERMVPGIQFQVQGKNGDLMIDFNGYFGYRFTGRLTSGIGWNQRYAYSKDVNTFNPNARIFGPRAFGEFKLGRGFSTRIEIETMNTVVPPFVVPKRGDIGKREWVFGAMVGIKKEYRFYKNIKGTTTIMFNLFNHIDNKPYMDVVNARFGFEFPMKKKRKVN